MYVIVGNLQLLNEFTPDEGRITRNQLKIMKDSMVKEAPKNAASSASVRSEKTMSGKKVTVCLCSASLSSFHQLCAIVQKNVIINVLEMSLIGNNFNLLCPRVFKRSLF